MYIESKQSIGKIAELKKRRGTILIQLRAHNEAVERSGCCPKCRLAQGKFDSVSTKQQETVAQVTVIKA